MSATVLYMSMSLDGFIAGPNETPENGLGDGGHRLHQWSPNPDPDRKVTSGYLAGVNRQVQDEAMATGAVVAGRGTFEPAGAWGGDHHDGVPIFILTRHDPDDLRQWPLVSYLSDVTSAMTQAKEAAGDKNVMVQGAGTAQLAIAAGVLDELELHVIPVLFGQGRRLFEGLAAEQIELERTPRTRGGGRRHPHALPGPALNRARPVGILAARCLQSDAAEPTGSLRDQKRQQERPLEPSASQHRLRRGR